MAKFKEGDRVRCLPGFRREGNSSGGSGYVSGRVFTVREISPRSEDGHTVYWPKEPGIAEDGKELSTGYGMFERALELVPTTLPIFN